MLIQVSAPQGQETVGFCGGARLALFITISAVEQVALISCPISSRMSFYDALTRNRFWTIVNENLGLAFCCLVHTSAQAAVDVVQLECYVCPSVPLNSWLTPQSVTQRRISRLLLLLTLLWPCSRDAPIGDPRKKVFALQTVLDGIQWAKSFAEREDNGHRAEVDVQIIQLPLKQSHKKHNKKNNKRLQT